MSEPIDCEYQPHIVCPYCGYVHQDSWEIDDGTSECLEVECGNCELEFDVTVDRSVDYTSKPKVQKAGKVKS